MGAVGHRVRLVWRLGFGLLSFGLLGLWAFGLESLALGTRDGPQIEQTCGHHSSLPLCSVFDLSLPFTIFALRLAKTVSFIDFFKFRAKAMLILAMFC